MLILVCLILLFVTSHATDNVRKRMKDMSSTENEPKFKESSIDLKEQNQVLEQKINTYRSESKKRFQSIHSQQPQLQDLSNISSTNYTSTPGSFFVYVSSDALDGYADPNNCDVTSTTPLITCNLRSAWSLCDAIVATNLDLCYQSNGTIKGVVSCSVVLEPYSTHQLMYLYGYSLDLPYTKAQTSSSCRAEFSIISNSNSTYALNTSSYPLIQGDSTAANSFFYIVGMQYPVAITIQSLNIVGFNGGAISYFNILATINDCHFSGNGRNLESQLFGGAFVCDHCDQTYITWSSFTNNLGHGSVAFLLSTAADISNTTFHGNSGNYSGALLGYVLARLNVAYCNFTSNSAVTGGAIYFSDSGSDDSPVEFAKVENCLFNANSASQSGGAVLINIGIDARIFFTASTFQNNIAIHNGGAMSVLASQSDSPMSLIIERCNFSKNIAELYNGGAIYVYWARSTVSNSVFNDNSALGNGGGGIYFDKMYTAHTSLCTFKSNSAYFGGAILVNYVYNVVITDISFTSNTAIFGGAIGNYWVITSNILNSNFTNNIASYGGAIRDIGDRNNEPRLVYTSNIFESNIATFKGGAISVSRYLGANITDCTFFLNSAEYGAGGAAHFQYITNYGLVVVSSSFKDCTAYKGGAVYIQASSRILFDTCQFSRNIAASNGGAIYFDHFNSYIAVYNSEFAHNIASHGSGGALYFAETNTYISIGGYLPQLQTLANPNFVAFRDNRQVQRQTLLAYIPGDRFYVSVDSTSILDSELGFLGAEFMSLDVSILNGTESVQLIKTNFSNVAIAGSYLQHILHTLPGYGTHLPIFILGSSFLVDYIDTSSTIIFQVFPFGSDAVLFKENSARLFGGAIHWQKSNKNIFIMPNVVFENNWVYQFGAGDDDSFISGLSEGSTKLSDDDSHPVRHNQSVVAVDDFLFDFKGVNNSDQSSVYDDSIGGAISFYQSNSNINIFSVEFRNNIAGYGGAISLFQSNSNVNIYQCTFLSNKADQKDGAAIYLGTSNSNIAIADSVFTGNVAGRDGGSCYLRSSNTVDITGCTFLSNSAGQDAGAVYLSLINVLTIGSSTFENNLAQNDGGALYADNGNSLVLVGGLNISDGFVNVFNLNSALTGGAMNFAVSNSVVIKGVNILSNNGATFEGSAILASSAITFNMVENSALYILNNYVPSGSALYFGPSCILHASGINASIVFSGNSYFVSQSEYSSAMYWVYNYNTNFSFGGAGTHFGSNSYIPVNWSGQAGTHIATQPVKLTMSLPTYTILNYQSEILPPIHLTLEDYYGRSFRNDNFTIISVSISNSSCSVTSNHSVSSGVAGLGGIQLKLLRRGVAVFENLTVSCYPGGSLTLQFAASLGGYELDATYDINATSVIKFRRCTPSETIVDGKCCSDCGKFAVTSAAVTSPTTNILTLPAFIAPVAIVGACIAALALYFIWRSMAGYLALLKLPTHRELRRHRFDDKAVLATIEVAPLLTLENDIHGKSALEIAIDVHASDAIILALAVIALPIDVSTKTEHPGDKHKHAWTKLIQSDQHVHLLDSILSKNQGISELLCKIQDEKGRTAVDIATPLCAKCLKENTYFLKRFVFVDASYPEHASDTCVLHIAVDHLSVEKQKVALKFMSSEEMYHQELISRKKYNVDPLYVINIIDTFDATLPENSHLLEQFTRFGFANYPYVIIMPAADRSLFYILSSENIAAKNWPVIKSIASDITSALSHIHEHGFIHGDLKPTNIMRMHGHIVLIDLDASATIGEFAGLKFSSGYVPPELLVEQAGIVSFRPSIPASSSFDMWSFGVVLFELFSGIKLFETTGEGNVTDNDTLQLIRSFEGEFKRKKLNMIKDIVARNLVAQMLHIDASKRITAAKVLNHSFFSKNVDALKNGATYDVFISYRVASDSNHAQLVYDQLTAAGFKVYLDKLSIRAGHFWEEEFCNGLASSYIFLPLLSRGAINDASESRQCLSKLTSSSPCDNVLLEYMLALELQMRGLIVNIYPVMIGDIKLGNDNIYGNYFKDGCHPSFGADDVYVKNNQSALEGHLDRLGLGTPMLDDLSVSKTVKEITKNQGLFVEGNIRSCLQKLSTHVASMRKDIDSMVAAASQSAVKSTRKQSLQVTSSDSFSKVVPPSLSSSLPSHKVVPLPQLANASATSTQAPVNFPDVYSIKVTSEDIPIEVNPIVQISSPTSPASQPISPLKTQKNSKKTKSSKVKSNDGNMLGSEDNQQPTGSPLKEVYGEQRDAVQLKYTSPESERRKDQYMQSTQDYSSAREPSSYSFNPTDSYNSDPRRRHPPSPRNMIYLDDNTKRYGYSDNTHSRNQYNDRIPFDQNPISRTLPVRQELYPPAPYYGNNSGYDNYGRRYDESQSPYSPNPAPHMPLRHYTPHQQDSYNNTYVPSRGDPARPHSPSAQDYPSSRPYGRDTQSGASNDSRFQSADDEARYRRGEPRRKH